MNGNQERGPIGGEINDLRKMQTLHPDERLRRGLQMRSEVYQRPHVRGFSGRRHQFLRRCRRAALPGLRREVRSRGLI